MLKDTVAFAKHIEDMMRDTLGVSKEESIEEEDELPEEDEEVAEEGKDSKNIHR